MMNQNVFEIVVAPTEIQNHAINNEDDDDSRWIRSFLEEMNNVPPPLSPQCCIYTVPPKLKENNVEAYTPQVVSIGPIHYNKKLKYNRMEVEKKKYLQPFLDKIGMSLRQALDFVKKRETGIRNCYQEVIELTSSELVGVVLVDAVFVFIYICGGPLNVLGIQNDPIYGEFTLLEAVYLDMLLLENQLPFFIFEDLFKLVLGRDVLNEVTKNSTSIHLHCYESFKFIAMQVPYNIKESKHIIDLLRRCLYPSRSSRFRTEPVKRYDYTQILPTATELKETGVKFKVGSESPNGSVLNIDFKHGVFQIPLINVSPRTEIMFRNILAFEQCHCPHRYVTQYIMFMESWIKTPRDAEILVENHIMLDPLGSSESASALLHNLGYGLALLNRDKYHFASICDDLIAYQKSFLHRWMANLRHKYLGTPWKVLSVIAAIVLLILTITQTSFNILGYYYRRKK